MKFTAFETRARVGKAVLVIALLLVVGISLTSYLQSAGDLAKQRRAQLKLQAALLTSVVSAEREGLTDARLQEHLKQYGLISACAVFSADGAVMVRASTVQPEPDWRLLTPKPASGPGSAKDGGSATGAASPYIGQTTVRTEGE